jgi:hypothetical protein
MQATHRFCVRHTQWLGHEHRAGRVLGRHVVKNLRSPRMRVLPSFNKRYSLRWLLPGCRRSNSKGLTYGRAPSRYTSPMLPSIFVQWTTAILAAGMGGYGVFCTVYSSASLEIAVKGIVMLGCACALSYFQAALISLGAHKDGQSGENWPLVYSRFLMDSGTRRAGDYCLATGSGLGRAQSRSLKMSNSHGRRVTLRSAVGASASAALFRSTLGLASVRADRPAGFGG